MDTGAQRMNARSRLSTVWLTVVGASVLLFLCLPVLIVAPMSFSSAQSLEFPPPSLSLRWYENLLGNPIWIDAGKNSLMLATLSSSAAIVLGTLAAYVLVRGNFPGRHLLEANFMAPMIVPSIITAVALYIFFARIGLLGSFTGLVLGHTILAVPYVVLIMQAAIRSFDIRIEQVAATLGASQRQILTMVVLPNLAPSAAAAWIFTFVMSFDEVVVTLFISGTTTTIPKRMFSELMLQVNPTITAVATLLIAFNLVALAGLLLLTRRRGFPGGMG
ncbi:ABC transporter permease [Mesorhizobium denitrificans]|uniref:ABC transporter permease n=2 Tax=Phyllobacteriaceae TaxID=69277 RepID=A0A371XK56_9HYPH|nr:ABC transporter permease [Mesorhizobium denitrificans]